jgi:hypothetical protein
MQHRTIAAGAILAVALSSATALASADAAPSHPSRAHAKARPFAVTATVNKTEPLQGSSVKIKGSVRPAAPGAKVTLLLRYLDQKKWKVVASTRLSAEGKFKFKDKVSSVRTRKYRVVKAAAPGRGAGHSKQLTVTVFGWRDLTSIHPATSNGFVNAGTVAMNGVSYPSSLRSYNTFPPGTPSSIDYNLNRDCKAFRGTAGLDDTSQAGGNTTITVLSDSTLKFAGAFTLTQSAPVAFDVTNVFRLSVGASMANGGVAALGTPQVLCSF